MDWFKTLTIINSVALIIFLLVSIIAGIKVLQILNRLDKMAMQAKNIADNAEHFAETVRNTANLAFVSKLAGSAFDTFKKRSSRK